MAFDIPPFDGFSNGDIAREIFTGPKLLEKVAGADAGSFEEAKIAAERPFRELLAGARPYA